jgi:hypothetical protein
MEIQLTGQSLVRINMKLWILESWIIGTVWWKINWGSPRRVFTSDRAREWRDEGINRDAQNLIREENRTGQDFVPKRLKEVRHPINWWIFDRDPIAKQISDTNIWLDHCCPLLQEKHETNSSLCSIRFNIQLNRQLILRSDNHPVEWSSLMFNCSIEHHNNSLVDFQTIGNGNIRVSFILPFHRQDINLLIPHVTLTLNLAVSIHKS